MRRRGRGVGANLLLNLGVNVAALGREDGHAPGVGLEVGVLGEEHERLGGHVGILKVGDVRVLEDLAGTVHGGTTYEKVRKRRRIR